MGAFSQKGVRESRKFRISDDGRTFHGLFVSALRELTENCKSALIMTSIYGEHLQHLATQIIRFALPEALQHICISVQTLLVGSLRRLPL